MFSIALLIGTYSYSIFLLGLLHSLTQSNIFVVSLIFLFLVISNLKLPQLPKLDFFCKVLFGLIILQCLVNLIGALGPEIGFDALWYHLTLPKIWLQHNQLIFIPGSQFKYSVMPMLTEMFYFIFPGKIVHYIFGILCLVVTYKLSRRYLNLTYSLLAVLIFSSNLVFSWESTSAYIDLARTFFEALALYLFLDNKPYQSAISLGFAIATKLLAITTFPIFILFMVIKKIPLKKMISYLTLVALVILPWLLRAYFATGNPIYPFFTSLYTDTHVSLDPRNLLTLLTHSADPINPIYFLTIILLIKLRNYKYLTLYSLLAIVVWILTPNSGGGRFFLPYLPALSVVTTLVISKHKFLILLVIPYSIFVIGYRSIANIKYFQPKESLLYQKLNFNFGDYYDFDHFFKPTDTVLPIGINNLYYLNANIALPNENIKYLLVRGPLPKEFQNWQLISQNAINKTQIYERPR